MKISGGSRCSSTQTIQDMDDLGGRTFFRRIANQRVLNRVRCSKYQTQRPQQRISDSKQTADFIQRLLAAQKIYDLRKLEKNKFPKLQNIDNNTTNCFGVPRDKVMLPVIGLNCEAVEEEEKSPKLASLKTQNRSKEAMLHPQANGAQQSTNLTSNQRSSLPDISEEISCSKFQRSTSKECHDLVPGNTVSFALDRHSPILNKSQSSSKNGLSRSLQLSPKVLPRVYSLAPTPLRVREFLTPTIIRGPVTDKEWEELKNCRYIRHL